MKRKIISVFLILAVLAGAILTTACGNLNVDRPQPEPQKQEENVINENPKQDEPKQEAPGKQDPKQENPKQDEPKKEEKKEPAIDEDGSYTSKEDVALYLWTYKKLPSNFITKNAAENLGWKGGGLDKYPKTKGKCIGGDKFGNREGLLPKNHKYIECDIDTLGAKERGAKRIVFADDCSLIYYTEDHYNTFELLYGEE